MNYFLRSFLICFVMTAAVWAQNIRGNIVGQVTDPTGSAIAGATVSVLNQGTGIVLMRLWMEAATTQFRTWMLAGTQLPLRRKASERSK